jgi:hypothetical protein
MTGRKSDLTLPARTPTYVSREVGAAELCVSPDTWDRMVASGELPPPDNRFLGAMPRWKWAKVEAWLSSAEKGVNIPPSPYVEAAEAAGRAKTERKWRG